MNKVYEVYVRGSREWFDENAMFEQLAPDAITAMERVREQLEAKGDERATWSMGAVLKKEN